MVLLDDLPRPILEPPEALGALRNFVCPAQISGHANFAELWDRRVVAGGLINNNMSTNWLPHV
jgi:hypothetical protein